MATRADFARIARNRIRITPDAQLDPAAVDKTGSTLNILVNGAAALAEELDARSAARFAEQIVAGARGEGLDRLILERSKGRLPRKTASAATIDLQLYRTSAAAGEGQVDAGTEILAGGLTWTLDTSVIFSKLTLKGGLVTATCTTLGDAGNGVRADIYGFKNPGSIFDPTLVVEAQASAEPAAGIASAGGDEVESDEAYRDRYALWDAGLDRSLLFLAAGVLGVDGVAVADAVEDLDGDGIVTGGVTIYFGDRYGRANTALVRRVAAAMSKFRLLGQTVRAVGTSPIFLEVSLQFAVLDSSDVVRVRQEARALLVSFINKMLPGSTLLRETIREVLSAVEGLVFLESAPFGLEPGSPGDMDRVPATKGTLYRTREDLVTFEGTVIS